MRSRGAGILFLENSSRNRRPETKRKKKVQHIQCLQSLLFSTSSPENTNNNNSNNENDKLRSPEDAKVELISEGNRQKNLQNNKQEEDAVESVGLTRTILLAVPLFCKLIIVLMIKFLTDLVVFPLLYLYRFARLTKRKIKSLFTSNNNNNNNELSKIRPNGTSAAAATNGLENKP
jgi:hypothetical protein